MHFHGAGSFTSLIFVVSSFEQLLTVIILTAVPASRIEKLLFEVSSSNLISSIRL